MILIFALWSWNQNAKLTWNTSDIDKHTRRGNEYAYASTCNFLGYWLPNLNIRFTLNQKCSPI